MSRTNAMITSLPKIAPIYDQSPPEPSRQHYFDYNICKNMITAYVDNCSFPNNLMSVQVWASCESTTHHTSSKGSTWAPSHPHMPKSLAFLSCWLWHRV